MFKITIESDMGDTWEWFDVTDAQAVWELLGYADLVTLVGKPVRHGEASGP